MGRNQCGCASDRLLWSAVQVHAVSISALPSWQSVLSGLPPAVTRDGVLRQRLKTLLQRCSSLLVGHDA